MQLEITGFKEVEAYLDGVAHQAPAAAGQGVQAGLDLVADELRLQLAQGGPKVVERHNNLYTQFSVGRRAVSATLPGLHSVGFIAITGLEAGKGQRRRFPTQAQADKHARDYAEQLRRAEGEAEIKTNVQTLPNGAQGTLTAEAQDDDATQRAWDVSSEQAGQVAEDEIRKRLEL